MIGSRMNKLLRRLIKGIAYLGAALVILLAIAVGIFRLMLPRLPEYQEEIKAWASDAIGLRVEFSGMNARWRLSGPEVSFFDAELIQPVTGQKILTAEEVGVGVGLLRLITDRELVVDRILVQNTTIDLRQNEQGNWTFQGQSVDTVSDSGSISAGDGGFLEIIGEDVTVNYEHPTSGQLVKFVIRSATVSRDGAETSIDAAIDLPAEFGSALEFSANQVGTDAGSGRWRYYIEGNSLNLAGWSRLRPPEFPELDAGIADISLWVNTVNGDLQSANANVAVRSLVVDGPETLPAVGVHGSFEYSAEPGGWLLAAEQFRFTTVNGAWPETDMQLRVNVNSDGAIDTVRSTASYFKLDDLAYIVPWLTEEQRFRLKRISPSGVIRNLRAEISEIQSTKPQFDVASDLAAIGFAAEEDRPGLKGFSGRLRADRNGGRVEIESTDVTIDLGRLLSEPIAFDDAFGTVIWRRSSDGFVVLSDSVRIRNADLESESSLQISMPADGSAPVVDFESEWSIYDLSSMPRYLPRQTMSPALHTWLSNALISGQVARGRTVFSGATDDFPFENGKGTFRINASVRNATLKYASTWPAAEFRHLDLVVENTRLYSQENSATNLGNNVDDATIEIADLRNPILEIDAFATGSLETIRQYAIQSPIHAILGGQLDRVQVDGDASFDLSLTVPILDRLNFDFATRIRSSNGTISVTGLPAPVTELNGVVTVTRDEVSSDELVGKFLGEPVDIVLSRATPESAGHSVILEAAGNFTAEGLKSGFGVPTDLIGHGRSAYLATVRFPDGRAENPSALQIQVDSDLQGFALDLPAPLAKELEESVPLSATIEFPSARSITSAGSLDDAYNWKFQFLKDNDGWRFDRGVLAVGGEQPGDPDIRGLRIAGQTSQVRLQDWLDLARREDGGAGIGSLIRAIDLRVADLHVIGQNYKDHRVEVNRSGLDWVVQISGEQADGTVTVPYDFQSGRVMSLNMNRLVLPGDESQSNAEPGRLADPRRLPSISVNAQEFALGDRQFGALTIDLEHTDRGLEASNLSMTDDTFNIEGSFGWIVDANETSGQRSFVQAALKSSDVEQTMRRLNYEAGVSGDELLVNLDLSWDGGPRQNFIDALSGSVTANLGAGQMQDVEPGAGRVFGLMSIVALPRRLSLDFRDVFDSGFGFDEIGGTFRIINGEAFTCNLSLVGPAADVGIIGRAGLGSRDYSQVAVVSANVGSTLPIVGYFVGGPQVAAALFVFSQIFKKPLDEVAQVYYSVEGSWDDPAIDRTDAEQFSRIATLAECGEETQ